MPIMSIYLLFIWFIGMILSDNNDISVDIPRSCINLNDGYHWLKLLDDTNDTIYPIINQKCSNGYIIIDVNHDSNVKEYFTSFEMYHYALGGPNQMDGVNWESWFILNGNKYIISPKCDICNENNMELNPHGILTSYYMTGTMFGCLTTHKAERDCSWDWDTYECKYCTLKDSDGDLGYHVMYKNSKDYNKYYEMKQELINGDTSLYMDEDGHDNSWMTLQIGLCGVYPLPSNQKATALNRDECFDFTNTYQPSIGTDGRYCQCISTTNNDKITVSMDTFNKYKNEFTNKNTNDNSNSKGSIDDVYNLYQKDFQYGTYRILKPGIYNIMEDIIYDFNPGLDMNHPNSEYDDSWWPNSNQSDIYPGAYDTRDEYFMGFWAGISIETDNVTLNLNGYELKMSKAFYYQQRFFANIALKSFVFSLNQGPGIFGANPKFPNNIIIKNGIVGLSSHHGVHGQGNQNVLIQNVHVRDFETHGIELSAFKDVVLRNVNIGPSSNIAYLNGEYTYARFTIQRLDRIKKDPTKFTGKHEFPIQFAGRDTTLELTDIIENLRESMDMAFKHVMGIERYDDNNEKWMKAKKLFVNDDGIPYGAVMYGLFLNLYFANVFQIHPSMKHSKNALIENVEIHDLVHKTREYYRLDKYHDTPYSNPYNAGFDAESLLGIDVINMGYGNQDWTTIQYRGDVLIDAHIAMDIATDDWGEKQLLFIDTNFRNWALGKYSWTNDEFGGYPYIGCNGDRMTHVNKGTIGIRMDGVNGIQYNNLKIHHLYEKSKLGSDKCSEYWDGNMQKFYGTGHFLQNAPYLYGYTGNLMHGIFSDWAEYNLNKVEISYLESSTGPVKGIAGYVNVNINIQDSIDINNLYSGTALYHKDTKELKHPYAPTVSKPIHLVKEWIKSDKRFYSNIKNDDNYGINLKCIIGNDGIDDDYYDYNTFIKNVDNNNCSDNDTRGYIIVIMAAIIVSMTCIVVISLYFCHNWCYKLCHKSNNEYKYVALSQNENTNNYGSIMDSDNDIY